MTYSQRCIDAVKGFEGLRTAAYRCPAGLWTLGYGHTSGVRAGMRATEAQANAWLREDLDAAAADVRRLVTVPLTQGQFDALCSFVFNVGAWKFETSTMRRLLNAGDYGTVVLRDGNGDEVGWTGALGEFQKWVHAGDQRLPGLVARRKREAEMFRS